MLKMAFIIAVSNLLSHVFNLPEPHLGKGERTACVSIWSCSFSYVGINQTERHTCENVRTTFWIFQENFAHSVSDSRWKFKFIHLKCSIRCLYSVLEVGLASNLYRFSLHQKKKKSSIADMHGQPSQLIFLTLSLTRPHPTTVHSALLLSFLPSLDNKAQKDRFMFYSSVRHHQPAQDLTSNMVNKCLLH